MNNSIRIKALRGGWSKLLRRTFGKEMGQKFKNQQTLFLFVELYYTVFFNDWTKIVLDPICDHIEIRSSDRLKFGTV